MSIELLLTIGVGIGVGVHMRVHKNFNLAYNSWTTDYR